jgi:glycosyltransferase involved in cell wall biosynthesis
MSKKDKSLRLFINSNAPWSISGYGQQMAELVHRMRQSGYPLAVSAFYGLEGGILNINDVVYYPKINHVYGSDALVHHAQDFGADVVFTLQDIWVLHPTDLQKTKRWIPVVPIDHEPVPKQIVDRLKLAYRIVTYSKFGHEELKRNGLHSTYIPHTVDTEAYAPQDKVKRKKEAGLPENVFLVGMVAANKDNPPRKSFQEALEAFKMFLEKVPNAMLYIHTFPDFPGGFPIKQFAEFLGVGDKIIFPNEYLMNFKYGKEQMSNVYNTLDMLLCVSTNEGFGVPIIEAQSCGVPVVVNNFTSMPELVQNHITGEVCDVLYKRYDQLGSYVAIPDPKSIYDCMMRIYQSDRTKMSKAARKFIVENYDSATVYNEKWVPFLSRLEEEV